MRRILAVLVGAGIAVVGGAVVAEYPFSGVTVVVMGLLFGFFLAEAVVAVVGGRGAFALAVSTLSVGAGLLWAAWLSSPRAFGDLSLQGWLAVAAGVVVAALRARPPAPAGDAGGEP